MNRKHKQKVRARKRQIKKQENKPLTVREVSKRLKKINLKGICKNEDITKSIDYFNIFFVFGIFIILAFLSFDSKTSVMFFICNITLIFNIFYYFFDKTKIFFSFVILQIYLIIMLILEYVLKIYFIKYLDILLLLSQIILFISNKMILTKVKKIIKAE